MGLLKSEKSSYNNQANLYERVKKLLVSYEWSDCSFSFSGKVIKAHKLILCISSPVFEAMFYGPLSTDNEIVITDIEPDIFQLVLNYIYTDTVEISCFEQAFELLYASRKYILENLSDMCVKYIKSHINIDNVIEILNYPDYMQDKKLLSLALKLFCEHARYLLEERNDTISCSCMKHILESDQMNITEKGLIIQVFEWSLYYCEQNNIPPIIENRRDVLKSNGFFELLRFPTLTLEEMEDIFSNENNLLLPLEFEDIKQNIKCPDLYRVSDNLTKPIGKIYFPRKLLKLQWSLCYRSPLRSVGPIVIDSNNYTIHSRFKSNKSIFINKLCVPTRMASAAYYRTYSPKVYYEQLSVSISCETDNSIMPLTNFKRAVEYDSIADIKLVEPCYIKKDSWYKICFVWPRNRYPVYSYIVELRDKEYTGHGVNFEFDDVCFSAGNGGSFLGGVRFCM